MSNFEIIALNFTFVLGLGIAQILNSIASAIRDRKEHALHWIPLAWATLLFVYHVQFWFGLLRINAAIEIWHWGWYALMLGLAVLLFVAGALVLPGRGSRAVSGLREDFDANGRIALVALTAYILLWIVPNAKVVGGFGIHVIWNLSLALPPALAWFRQPRVRSLATAAAVPWTLALMALAYAGPDAGN